MHEVNFLYKDDYLYIRTMCFAKESEKIIANKRMINRVYITKKLEKHYRKRCLSKFKMSPPICKAKMAPFGVGRCSFEIDLEDMPGSWVVLFSAGALCSKRFSERSWRVFGNTGFSQPYRPCSIQVLTGQDSALCIGSLILSRRDINGKPS